MLAAREHSEDQLKKKLLSKKEDPDDIEAALASLKANRLLDDERFATELVQQASAKGEGIDKIRRRLKQAGVASHASEKVIGNLPDDHDRAMQAAAKRASSMGELPPEVALRRLVGWLQRRGHSLDVSLEAARTVLGAEVD